MKDLKGKRIGVAATRKADVISTLIQKNGGTPFVFSIQGEQILNEETSKKNVKELMTKPFDLVLLTTGIGAETLENTADKMNLLPDFIWKLENTTLAVRGSKTVNWLKKQSLSAKFVSEDGTMENLLNSLAARKPDTGNRLFLQAYNQDDITLKQHLENIGYYVYLSKPYHYKEPDYKTLSNLRQEIINELLEAVIFTSKGQVQNLFKASNKSKEMVDSFNNEVLAVAVGKVTAHELEQKGIVNVFQPIKPKMGAMVVELREYLA
ncbi:uroporphyrinogen-III synthase [Virgibacillus necropolis]|uniref:Uroporphyrinogen-III synthase n=1 Tax=Virgibacillus necropolis TaxID=163877 RepID=A0A221MGM6_9BACI|nr:uroporphyrinogen-III synthase [Virgibacillus necropolis]ASN06791.1 uroporphyrinogen-III synthase [Virgibacillus necropolis]